MELTDAQIEALEQVDLKYREARAILDNAKLLREREIRRIAAEGGPYRAIGTVAGVSYQRVAQIVGNRTLPKLSFDAARDVECPKCGAQPGQRCDQPSGRFHIERHHARHDVFTAEHPELR